MPGDSFPLAVRVRGQINVMGVSGSLLQTLYNFLFARDILVLGFKTVFNIDAHLFIGKILNVPYGGSNFIVGSKILFNRSYFCGRFHNN